MSFHLKRDAVPAPGLSLSFLYFGWEFKIIVGMEVLKFIEEYWAVGNEIRYAHSSNRFNNLTPICIFNRNLFQPRLRLNQRTNENIENKNQEKITKFLMCMKHENEE